MSKEKEHKHMSKSKLNLGDKIQKTGMGTPNASQHCSDKKWGKPPPKTGLMGIIGELPQPIRTFGPKQFQALSQYRTSVVVYSITAILATCYFTEWKDVLQYLPYYNGKYKNDD